MTSPSCRATQAPDPRGILTNAALVLGSIPVMACLGLVPRTSIEAMQQAASAAADHQQAPGSSLLLGAAPLLRGMLPFACLPLLFSRLQQTGSAVLPDKQGAQQLSSSAVGQLVQHCSAASNVAGAVALAADQLPRIAEWLAEHSPATSTVMAQSQREGSLSGLRMACVRLCFALAAAAAGLHALAAVASRSRLQSMSGLQSVSKAFTGSSIPLQPPDALTLR